MFLILSPYKYKDSPFPLKNTPGNPEHEAALIMKMFGILLVSIFSNFSNVNVGFIVSCQTLCKGNNSHILTFFCFTA